MNDPVVVFKALSSESRLKIMRLLKEHPQCVNVIATRLDLTQPAVSQHLRLLRYAGLVRVEKRGNWMHYSFNHKAVRRFGSAVAEILGLKLNPLKKTNGTINCPPELLRECRGRLASKKKTRGGSA